MAIHTKRYTQHIDCIYKQHLVNQGIVMCAYGDPSDCDNCPKKTPRDIECEASWTSYPDPDDYDNQEDCESIEYVQ